MAAWKLAVADTSKINTQEKTRISWGRFDRIRGCCRVWAKKFPEGSRRCSTKIWGDLVKDQVFLGHYAGLMAGWCLCKQPTGPGLTRLCPGAIYVDVKSFEQWLMFSPCTPKPRHGAALTSMKGSRCQKTLSWLSSFKSPIIFLVIALGMGFW